MTAKEALRQLVEAADLLDFLAPQDSRDEASTEDIPAARRGEAEISRGDYITLDDLRAGLRL